MIALTLLLVLYFLPTLIARHRGQPAAGTFWMNLLFGWTGVGWFALLLWALLSLRPVRLYTPATFPGTRCYAWERF